MNCSGVVSKWVLVYGNSKVIVAQYNDSQMTCSTHTIETFDTEAEMEARITSLGLTPLPPEEEH